MTIAEARETAAAEPKLWRAAVIEGTSPLTEDAGATVRLFETKRAAHDLLRERKSALVAEGFKMARGGLKYGVVVMVRGDEAVAVAMDYRGRLK